MATLVIETATAACSVALFANNHLRGHGHELVGRGHAERLVPMIGEVLAQAGATRVDGLLVDCGPGSFTGIRVGLAAARALGLAWGASVSGYSTLSLVAAAFDGAVEEENVAVALIGGHGELFVQRFTRRPLAPLHAMRSLDPAMAARSIPDRVVLGSGAATLVAARGRGEAIARVPNSADAPLLPAPLAALPPNPIYGRAPDAAIPR